ncbi:hypothetical protein QVD17_19933 [Tagetes erecta]|uniref:Uncharacterized protein n=1 Tax=Tagetes erecta TaxID=13708 RepID=A0AAD8KRU6_TARER|nr:hypothetical protein QVD17_19933 [Tagetes erecta]
MGDLVIKLIWTKVLRKLVEDASKFLSNKGTKNFQVYHIQVWNWFIVTWFCKFCFCYRFHDSHVFIATRTIVSFQYRGKILLQQHQLGRKLACPTVEQWYNQLLDQESNIDHLASSLHHFLKNTNVLRAH